MTFLQGSRSRREGRTTLGRCVETTDAIQRVCWGDGNVFAKLRKLCGSEPKPYTSSIGNHFYVNDICESVARDSGNPEIAKHLHTSIQKKALVQFTHVLLWIATVLH